MTYSSKWIKLHYKYQHDLQQGNYKFLQCPHEKLSMQPKFNMQISLKLKLSIFFLSCICYNFLTLKDVDIDRSLLELAYQY